LSGGEVRQRLAAGQSLLERWGCSLRSRWGRCAGRPLRAKALAGV